MLFRVNLWHVNITANLLGLNHSPCATANNVWRPFGAHHLSLWKVTCVMEKVDTSICGSANDMLED